MRSHVEHFQWLTLYMVKATLKSFKCNLIPNLFGGILKRSDTLLILEEEQPRNLFTSQPIFTIDYLDASFCLQFYLHLLPCLFFLLQLLLFLPFLLLFLLAHILFCWRGRKRRWWWWRLRQNHRRKLFYGNRTGRCYCFCSGDNLQYVANLEDLLAAICNLN